MWRQSSGRTWKERQHFTLLQQEVRPGKIEREEDLVVVSRQSIVGKTTLHLAAAKSKFRIGDREGTGWKGGQ